MGIGEMLCRALFKLVMRVDGYQAKMACGNMQLCAGLEAGMDCSTHTLGQRQLERSRQRRCEEYSRRIGEEEDEDEAAREESLTVETEGTEEEAA